MNLSIKELNELIYSLAITADKGMMCDKEVNATLLDKVYGELQFKLGLEDEVVENEDTIAERREDAKYEKAFYAADVDKYNHFVSNEEADEDAEGPTLYYRPKQSEKFNGVSQKILDYVEKTGNVSYKMLNDFYRQYTNGSNSLSHILKALLIPYKNRPTRRFLRQIARGTYAIDYATQYNWVENDVYNYND